MPRIKKGKTKRKHKKHILKYAKGYRFDRKSKLRAAREALFHAWTYAFRDRKRKKRDFRRLWQIQINAAVRQSGLSYSKFTNDLKKGKILLNRKVLANLAENNPEVFKKIVGAIKK